jgi:CRISPR-associated protein Cas1
MTHEQPELIRVTALHALAYCERLFYLEEVEEIRVADDAVYAGRTLHEEIEQTETRSFQLSSPSLGLVGKVDAVRHREGGWVPIEHKRGRCRRAKDGTPQAWPSDAIQVTAYAMLLEEFIGRLVAEGRIRYHAENVTVRVTADEQARAEVRSAIARARELRALGRRPPVTSNEKLCVRCSLAPVCLPEEERLAADANWETVRLFPPDDERRVLHVLSHGSRIGRSGEKIIVSSEGDAQQSFPIRDIGAVVLHGYAQISTQALHLCATNGVGVHWVSRGGRYVTGATADVGTVQRRMRQYEGMARPELRIQLARRLAMAKMENQLRFLLRATRQTKPRPGAVVQSAAAIRTELRAAAHVEEADTLRGLEGSAARAYFAAIESLLIPDVPTELRPQGRSRRPPRDRFNALLSFGYGMLYRTVLHSVLAVGLEPAFGFFHTPRSAAHPLVLDLMELYRVVLWDMVVIASLNRRQWDPASHFTVAKDHVWLSDEGRKLAIDLFERRLDETWKHPVTDYSLTYRRAIELEVRLLEKEWSGAPGLFARARLR